MNNNYFQRVPLSGNKKLKPMRLFLLVLVLAFFVSGCGKTTVTNTNQGNTNGNVSLEDTSDWLTFRDEKNGFEFKYPKGATVEDDQTVWQNDEMSAERLKSYKAAYTLGYVDQGKLYSLDIHVTESLEDVATEFTKWNKFENSGTVGYSTYLNKKMYTIFIRSVDESQKSFLKKVVDTVIFVN